MGWFGYGMYDGDGTFTAQLYFLELAGISQDRIDDYYAPMKKIKLSKEDKELFTKKLDKVIKNWKREMRKDGYNKEDTGLEYMMLGDLMINNQIPIDLFLIADIVVNTKLLLNEHCDDFDYPAKRKATIKRFLKKLPNVERKYPKKRLISNG